MRKYKILESTLKIVDIKIRIAISAAKLNYQHRSQFVTTKCYTEDTSGEFSHSIKMCLKSTSLGYRD